MGGKGGRRLTVRVAKSEKKIIRWLKLIREVGSSPISPTVATAVSYVCITGEPLYIGSVSSELAEASDDSFFHCNLEADNSIINARLDALLYGWTLSPFIVNILNRCIHEIGEVADCEELVPLMDLKFQFAKAMPTNSAVSAVEVTSPRSTPVKKIPGAKKTGTKKTGTKKKDSLTAGLSDIPTNISSMKNSSSDYDWSSSSKEDAELVSLIVNINNTYDDVTTR